MAQRMTTGEALRVAHDADWYTDDQIAQALHTLKGCRPSRNIKAARYALTQTRNERAAEFKALSGVKW